MRLKSVVRLVVSLLMCLGVGVLELLVTRPEIPTWYASLIKPSWTPLPVVFPIAWTALYNSSDGHQLLEALGDGAAICSALKGDGLVPGTTCAQRGVVADFFQLARHYNGSRNNIRIVTRYRRDDRFCVAGRSRRGLSPAPYLAWVAYATTINAGVVVLN